MLNFRPHKLQIKRASGGGYDEQGFPIPVLEYWDEPIACHYSNNDSYTTKRLYTYSDGTQRLFDYAVWLDPIQENLSAKYVRLIDEFGEIREADRKVELCFNGQLRTKLYL